MMRFDRLLILFYTIIYTIMMSWSATAAEQNASSKGEAKTLIVGVEDLDYLPHYSTRSGQYEGLGRDILDAFSAESGVKFEYKPVPINRLYSEFLNGTLDFKYPDNPNWKADEKKGKSLVYSTAIVQVIDGVVLPKEKANISLGEFKKLGIPMGFTPWPYLDQIKSGKVSQIEVSKFQDLLMMTLHHRVDGAYMNTAVAHYRLKELKKENELVFNPKLPYDKTTFQLSTVKRPKIIDQFNEFLKKRAELVASLKKKRDAEFGVDQVTSKD